MLQVADRQTTVCLLLPRGQAWHLTNKLRIRDLFPCPSSKAAPPFLTTWASAPSARTVDTNVVSMANLAPWNRLMRPVHNDLETSSVCHVVRPRCVSVMTLPPASRHTRTAADSRAKPHLPRTPTRAHCAVVATGVEWTATPTATCSERGGTTENQIESLSCERLSAHGHFETTSTLSQCR